MKFHKFPSTPHLIPNQAVGRSDKVLGEDDLNELLSYPVIVQEKIDGANLGISFDSEGNLLLQNRGDYIRDFVGQWKPLKDWIRPRIDRLFDLLEDRYILFGEWCYARHSIPYDRLPDWFLGFDVYDKHTGDFLSYVCRSTMFEYMGIHPVPTLDHGTFIIPELWDMLDQQSRFGPDKMEGIYIRSEGVSVVYQRAKLVRPDFAQSIVEHWSKRYVPNKLEIPQ